MKRQRKILILLLPPLVGLLVLILACSTFSVAVQQRRIAPPDINLTIAGVGIVANMTTVPSCAIWFVPCEITHLDEDEDAYALWVVWRPVRLPTEQVGAKRLIMIRIVPKTQP